MNTTPTPEQFIETLNRWKMTPKEHTISITLLFLTPTFIWAALVYLVGFEVTWLKVFGVYLSLT